MKKKQLFSLRKLSVGIASVSLGAALVFGGAAQAETQSDPAQVAVQKVDALQNLTQQQKDNFKQRIEQSAKTQQPPVDAVLKDATDLDAANAQDAAAIKKQVELAQNVGNQQKQVETAQNVAQEQVQKAQAEVNNLKNISDETKALYNNKIAQAGVAEIPEILKDAKLVDAQVDLAKNVSNEQVKKAQDQVNSLKNISKETKAQYNDRIAKAGVADIDGIVKEAQAADSQVGTAKNVSKEQVEKGQATVNKLTHLTKEQKAAFNDRIAKAGVADIPAIVKEAQDLDAKNAKNPVKKDQKSGQKSSDKVTNDNNNGKTKTGKDQNATGKDQTATGKDQTATGKDQTTTGKSTTNSVATNNKAAQTTQNAAGNKQLPETGEQDQVLFGLLSGSLFASAGTLFLLGARRRKEN